MTRHYTTTAKALHWLMALMIPGMLALGFYMEGLPFSPDKLQLYAWHKWAGVTVFILVMLRLAWRTFNRPPPLPDGMSAATRFAAHTGHGLLYLLMVAIPLSGWLMSSAKGVPTVWFGIWPLPDLLPKDETLGDTLKLIHTTLNWLLVALLVGHVGAALKHHFINKDDILARMLPVVPNRERKS